MNTPQALADHFQRGFINHLFRIRPGYGNHAHGNRLQKFHVNTAETDHQHLAELRIGAHAQQNLKALGQHLLDYNTLDSGRGGILAGVLQNGLISLMHSFHRMDSQADAAQIGLVKDIVRKDLHHHRETQVFCRLLQRGI